MRNRKIKIDVSAHSFIIHVFIPLNYSSTVGLGLYNTFGSGRKTSLITSAFSTLWSPGGQPPPPKLLAPTMCSQQFPDGLCIMTTLLTTFPEGLAHQMQFKYPKGLTAPLRPGPVQQLHYF